MKVGVMQPYFLPYLGYFSLIKNTDKFILIDEVQFMERGWIKRNRVLSNRDGWQYIGVPLVKHKQKTKIKDIRIYNSFDWKKKIFNQLEHYKKRAPFYNNTIEVLMSALNIETDSIVKLNEHVLKVICSYIGIEANFSIFSEMNLHIEKVNAPDEWGLNVCKALDNVEEYWNPEGGVEFYDCQKYHRNNIEINFLKINLQSYPQIRTKFEPGLSIVDVMMFNDSKDINRMLDDYILL